MCARLEISGQNTKKMALECGVTHSKIYKWLRDDAFLAEKARGKAEFRVDLSDIPLTHRRDRIEVSAGIANDEDEKSDTRLRAIKQISDETAADVEGMLAALQEQIDLLERQITGEIVALHR